MGADQSCAREAHAAARIPLDLLLLVDVSSSMNIDIGGVTKWQMASEALRRFILDPNSAGLGIGMQFFPLKVPCTRDGDCGMGGRCDERRACASPGQPVSSRACGTPDLGPCPLGSSCLPLGQCADTGASCTDLGVPCTPGGSLCVAMPKVCTDGDVDGVSCDSADYERPAVPIAAVPAGALPLLNTLSVQRPEDNFGTPPRPALRGAHLYLRRHLAARPDHRGAVIHVTDGEASACPPLDTESVAAPVAAARAASLSVPTYVIGVFVPEELPEAAPMLDRLAAAGGTGAPFVLDPKQDLTQELSAALNQIRVAALPCEYAIPPPNTGELDYARVNVHYQGVAGEQDILYVGQPGRCDPAEGGWYYDVLPANTAQPTRVVMCPATCKRFKADATARVELRFGCKRHEIP